MQCLGKRENYHKNMGLSLNVIYKVIHTKEAPRFSTISCPESLFPTLTSSTSTSEDMLFTNSKKNYQNVIFQVKLNKPQDGPWTTFPGLNPSCLPHTPSSTSSSNNILPLILQILVSELPKCHILNQTEQTPTWSMNSMPISCPKSPFPKPPPPHPICFAHSPNHLDIHAISHPTSPSLKS